MKPLLTFVFSLLLTHCFAQSVLETYKDSVYRFEIGMPSSGWQRVPGTDNYSPKFILRRLPAGEKDIARESYNLNIINKRTPSSLDQEYDKLVGYLKGTGNFTMVESGAITIHDVPVKWFLENHQNDQDKTVAMTNYVFIAYKDNKTYILTFATIQSEFKKYRELFDRVARTLVI